MTIKIGEELLGLMERLALGEDPGLPGQCIVRPLDVLILVGEVRRLKEELAETKKDYEHLCCQHNDQMHRADVAEEKLSRAEAKQRDAQKYLEQLGKVCNTLEEIQKPNRPSEEKGVQELRLCIHDKMSGQWVPVNIENPGFSLEPSPPSPLRPFEGQIGREITEALNHGHTAKEFVKKMIEIREEHQKGSENSLSPPNGLKELPDGIEADPKVDEIERNLESARHVGVEGSMRWWVESLNTLIIKFRSSEGRLAAARKNAADWKERAEKATKLFQDSEALRRAKEEELKVVRGKKDVCQSQLEYRESLLARLEEKEKEVSLDAARCSTVREFLRKRGWMAGGQDLDIQYIGGLLDILEGLQRSEAELTQRLYNLRVFGREVI